MTLGTHTNNYTLGRGELYFAKFAPNSQTPEGERYLGNTPEFALTIESENLDHFSSDRGIREKDDSVVLEVTRSGTLTTDNINPENVALFFFGAASVISQVTATVTDEAISGVQQDLYYQLGVSPGNPVGVRGLDVHTPGPPAKNIIVMDDQDPGTEFVEGTDYDVDMDLGRIYIIPGGSIVDGTNLQVSYKTAAKNINQVISGSAAIEGALRFIAQNPKGTQIDYFMPWVKLTPNGDYALKGEEWQQIPFNLEVLRKAGLEAIYANGRPFTPAP